MKLIDIISAISVIAIWASNFIAGKICLNYIPPYFLTSLRFGLTALFLLPFVKIPYGFFYKIFLLTITLGILHFGLVMVGLNGLDASTSAIAVQSGVPFSVLLAWIFLKEKLNWSQILGITIAFIGLLILMGEPQIFNQPIPFLIVVLSAFFWGVANLQSRGLGQVNPFSLNAWFALIATPQLFALSFIIEENQITRLLNADWKFYVSLLYMVIITTIIGYSMWYRLLGKYKISQVTPFNMMNPFFGTLLGFLFLNESITYMKVIGGIVILSGVAILVFYKKR